MSEATTPERLITLLDLGHLDNVGVCLDLGHAHATVGIPAAVETLGKRIKSLHVHDNHGVRDEHLWPGDGTIDWLQVAALLKALPAAPAAVLEIGYKLGDTPDAIPAKIQRGFATLTGVEA